MYLPWFMSRRPSALPLDCMQRPTSFRTSGFLPRNCRQGHHFRLLLISCCAAAVAGAGTARDSEATRAPAAAGWPSAVADRAVGRHGRAAISPQDRCEGDDTAPVLQASASPAAMSYDIADLLGLLDLEPLEYNIYRGRNRDIGSGRVFGGQVMAQALVAARRTIEEERVAHSVHGYFILPGDLAAPIVYFVDRLRDGGSFTTRRVTAIQHGRAVFNMSASFHRVEEGIEHQTDMPDVPPPDELPSELDLLRARADELPAHLRAVLTQDRPIDFRPVGFDPNDAVRREPLRHVWLRAIGSMSDDVLAHQAVLAYASDYGLLATALQPHSLNIRDPRLQAASLDHTLWFHRDFRTDDWLLYTMDSPAAAGARGFTRGTVYTRDGRLVASVAQEGLLRLRATGP
jgi:acyl-CoA thioesterase II